MKRDPLSDIELILKILSYQIENKNKFEMFPYVLWPVETLTQLELKENPLSGLEQSFTDRDLDFLRDYFKQRSSVAIFVSHAVIDFEPYRLADLADYLEAKKEVAVAQVSQ